MPSSGIPSLLLFYSYLIRALLDRYSHLPTPKPTEPWAAFILVTMPLIVLSFSSLRPIEDYRYIATNTPTLVINGAPIGPINALYHNDVEYKDSVNLGISDLII
jgi:hypothetical protein